LVVRNAGKVMLAALSAEPQRSARLFTFFRKTLKHPVTEAPTGSDQALVCRFDASPSQKILSKGDMAQSAIKNRSKGTKFIHIQYL